MIKIWFIGVGILTGLLFSPMTCRLLRHYFISVVLCFLVVADAVAISSCGDTTQTSDSWYDRGHDYLSQKFCEPAVWFDNFFSDERSDEERGAGSFVRLRNNFRFSKGNAVMSNQLSANVTLPNLRKRLHLFLMREDEDESTSALSNGLSRNTSVRSDSSLNKFSDTVDSQSRQSQLGLRYDLSDDRFKHFSLTGGVRAGTPLQPFVKGRYRYTKPLGSDQLVRFTETAYWKNLEGFGAISRLDLEQQLTHTTLARWSNRVTFSEISRGAELLSELSLLHQISVKSAVAVSLGAWGHTLPSTMLDTIVLTTRYRRNFYRRWLFYEIEPELGWPKDTIGGHKSVQAIVFRLEVQFDRH